MSDQFWSIAVTLVGLLGFWLAGRKIWWAWHIGVANQLLWVIYAVTAQQWGFLIGVPIYGAVFGRNAYLWTKEHRNA